MNEISLVRKYEAALKIIASLFDEISRLEAENRALREYKWMYEGLQ